MKHAGKIALFALSCGCAISAMSGAWMLSGFFLALICAILFGYMVSVSPEEEKMYTDAVNPDLKDPKPVKTCFKKKVPTRIEDEDELNEMIINNDF